MRPEAPVQRPRREAVSREGELEGGDVPAALANSEEAGAEPVASVTAERPPGLRACYAVHGDTRTSLKAPDAEARGGAGESVDRSDVQPAGPERHLERCDVGLARGRRRRSGEGFAVVYSGQRGVAEVDLDRRPLRQAQSGGALRGADPQELVGRDHVPAQGLAARGSLQLP